MTASHIKHISEDPWTAAADCATTSCKYLELDSMGLRPHSLAVVTGILQMV